MASVNFKDMEFLEKNLDKEILINSMIKPGKKYNVYMVMREFKINIKKSSVKTK